MLLPFASWTNLNGLFSIAFVWYLWINECNMFICSIVNSSLAVTEDAALICLWWRYTYKHFTFISGRWENRFSRPARLSADHHSCYSVVVSSTVLWTHEDFRKATRFHIRTLITPSILCFKFWNLYRHKPLISTFLRVSLTFERDNYLLSYEENNKKD